MIEVLGRLEDYEASGEGWLSIRFKFSNGSIQDMYCMNHLVWIPLPTQDYSNLPDYEEYADDEELSSKVEEFLRGVEVVSPLECKYGVFIQYMFRARTGETLSMYYDTEFSSWIPSGAVLDFPTHIIANDHALTLAVVEFNLLGEP